LSRSASRIDMVMVPKDVAMAGPPIPQRPTMRRLNFAGMRHHKVAVTTIAWRDVSYVN
jgi:hypothetical protein